MRLFHLPAIAALALSLGVGSAFGASLTLGLSTDLGASADAGSGSASASANASANVGIKTGKAGKTAVARQGVFARLSANEQADIRARCIAAARASLDGNPIALSASERVTCRAVLH